MAAVQDISITELLAQLGFVGPEAVPAREALERAGLTNPRKQRIARAKVARASSELARWFERLCHNCWGRRVGDGRTLVRVAAAACELCGGSNNARGVDSMVAACRRAEIRKIVFVGRSPSFRGEIEQLTARRLELRLIDGTARIPKASARNDVAWADLVVVCGSTELTHKVSKNYTRLPDARPKLVVTSRRSVEAIADEVTRKAVGSAAGPSRT
jgi:hypothetical protein